MSVFWLKYRGTKFPVRRGETILGRSPYCSIVISNRLVSRQHAAIRLLPGGLEIEDLGSANGTLVNSEPIIGARRLTKGDVIRIGSDFLEVDIADDPQRTAQDTQKVDMATEPEDSTTATYRSSVELIEALVSSATDAQKKDRMAQTIRNAIDSIVESQKKGEAALKRPAIVRLLATVEIVAGWFEDGSLDAWRSEVRRALQE